MQLVADDHDGEPLTYSATNLPDGLSIDPTAGDITGTIDPSALLSSPYSVTATVTNGTQSASQTFTWTIANTTHTPVLTPPANQTNAIGDAVDLSLTATDQDDDTIAYAASDLPAGLTIDPGTGIISGTISDSVTTVTSYSSTVYASNGITSASEPITWTVNPVGLENPGAQANAVGNAVDLPVSAIKASGTWTFTSADLPAGLSITGSSSTGFAITGTITSAAAASNAVTITANAGGSFTATQTFTWTVSSLTNPGTLTNTDGDTGVSVAVTASPPSGSAVTFTATGLPSGLSIAGSGHVGTNSGTVGATADLDSPYTVTVTGTQGSYSTSQVFTWIIEPKLVVSNPGPQTNAPGSVSLVIPVYYSGGSTVSYSASGLPSGLSITSTSNTSLTISGTISSGAISTTPYYVALTATQGSYTSTQNFDWTVPAFIVNPISDQSSNDGQSASLTVTASASATFSASGLPYGLTINSSTGVISGTVVNFDDTEDDDTVTVTATSGSNTASQTFDWTVSPNVNVVSPGDQVNAAGDMVAGVYVSGTDVNTSATLTYLVAGLPSGLSLDASTGLISGTIASGAWSASPYTVTIEATDGTYFDSQTFTWTVNRIVIVDPGPQIFGEGAVVSLAMASNTSVTWSGTGLSAAGLSINSSTGLISGTVGGSASSDSPYVMSVTASVSGAATVTDTFQLNVPLDGLATPADQTSTEGASVTLDLASTQSSSQTFVAAGLPPGLSINSSTGAITGTIAAGSAGSYTVDVSVTYSGTTTMTSFAWTVNPAITFTGTADQTNTVDNTSTLIVSASDAHSGTLTYSATGLPTGVSINSLGRYLRHDFLRHPGGLHCHGFRHRRNLYWQRNIQLASACHIGFRTHPDQPRYAIRPARGQCRFLPHRDRPGRLAAHFQRGRIAAGVEPG